MKTHLVIPELKFEKNFYAAIRSAEAFGVTEIDLIGYHNLKTWNTSHLTKGTANHINIKRFDTPEQCLDYLIGQRLKIVCIENAEKSKSLKDYKFPANIALIMGHEKLGVPDTFTNRYINIRIPQYGLVKCLNTSIATSIVLYERFIQRLSI